jgi:hypothetical protein
MQLSVTTPISVVIYSKKRKLSTREQIKQLKLVC